MADTGDGYMNDLNKGFYALNAAKNKQEKKPTRISELIEGEKTFDSYGFSLVKITHTEVIEGVGNVSVEQLLELPIKSTGVAEFQEELTGKAPRPPVKKEVIKKDSLDGKLLGLNEDRLMQVFDNTDEAYIDALEKHNQGFIWRIVVFALDIAWKKKDGTEAATFEEKKAILKSTGITGSHTDQIFKDVMALSRMQGAMEDFLSGN